MYGQSYIGINIISHLFSLYLIFSTVILFYHKSHRSDPTVNLLTFFPSLYSSSSISFISPLDPSSLLFPGVLAIKKDDEPNPLMCKHTHLVPSYLIPSYLILPYLTLSCPDLSCPVLSNMILSCPVLSYLITFYNPLSCSIPSNHV